MTIKAGIIMPMRHPMPYYRYCAISRTVVNILPYLPAMDIEPHVFSVRGDRRGFEEIDGIYYHRIDARDADEYYRGADALCSGMDVAIVYNRVWVPPCGTPTIWHFGSTHIKRKHLKTAQKVAFIEVVSGYLRNVFAREMPEIESKLRVNWLGVDTRKYNPDAAADRPPRPVLLWVGLLDAIKGLDTFVDVANRILSRPIPVDVVVVGPAGFEGQETSEYVESVRSRADSRILWLGERSDDQLPAIYASATVLLAPMRYPHPWAMVALEAQACGTPVVITDTGALADTIIDGETGYLCNPDDAVCMYHHVRQLLTDRDLYSRMSARAREHAMEFSWEDTARRTAGEVKEIVNG